MFFGEAVHPAFFGHFGAGTVLRGAGLHGGEFSEGGLPRSAVGRLMFLGELFHEIGTFQYDAAARR